MKGLLAFVFLFGFLPALGADPSTPAEFRVVFWNLKNFRLNPAEPPVKSIADQSSVIQTLAELNPDVLIVCEMGSREDLVTLAERLASQGKTYPHRAFVDGPDPDRHLAALSRFPFKDESQINLRFELAERVERLQRGLLDISLESPRLRILGLHLKSRRAVEDRNEQEIRRWEAHLVREHLDQRMQGKNLPVLVVGDLNETKDLPAVRAIAGAPGNAGRIRWLDLKDGAGDSWTYFSESTDTYSRIDFAGISAGFPYRLEAHSSGIHRAKSETAGSDHRPIFLTFALP